ncbi:MAG: hypothetical protein ACXV6M_01010 [Ilumatobacteraceae bacterium]
MSNHLLRSQVVDSLTVAGVVATFTGTAAWDGAANRRFVVTVEDRRRGGKKDPADTFTIRVTAPNGTVVFTGSGPLSSGSVTVQA